MTAPRLTIVLGSLAGFVLAMVPVVLCLAQGFDGPRGGGATPWAPGAAPPDVFGPGYATAPGMPNVPAPAVRPASWPGGPGPSGPIAPQWPMIALPPLGYARPCEGAQTLVRLPGDIIMTSDVLAGVDDLLARNRDKIAPEDFAKQRAEVVREVTAGLDQLVAHLADPDPASFVDPPQRQLIQQILRQLIERKLVYQDFLRGVEKERLPAIEQSVNREFEQAELPKLLKRENAQSRQDLEWTLRSHGSSLERQRQMFLEEVIYEQWMNDKIKPPNPKDNGFNDVTHEELLRWYGAHLQAFDRPARARWEELMVSFSKYRSRQEAYDAIAQMGNQVVQFGAPLAQVARARSDGVTAAQGGLREWTTRGNLASAALDQALFSLPVNRLSLIIEGTTGYHIIRVVERQEARRVPFLEVQKEVRAKIQKERLNKKYADYLDELRKQYPVWSIFDATARRPRPADADARLR